MNLVKILEIRYVLVGAGNVVFTLVAFWLVNNFWGNDIGLQSAYWLSAGLGVVNGFIWQRALVWRSKTAWHREFPKFLLLNFVIAVANSFLLHLFVTLLGCETYLSQILITIVLVATSFVVSRFWVFRTSDSIPLETELKLQRREK
jgi:putative flippase GtrA